MKISDRDETLAAYAELCVGTNTVNNVAAKAKVRNQLSPELQLKFADAIVTLREVQKTLLTKI